MLSYLLHFASSNWVYCYKGRALQTMRVFSHANYQCRSSLTSNCTTVLASKLTHPPLDIKTA